MGVEDPSDLEDWVAGRSLLARTVLGVDVLDDLTQVFRHPLQLGVKLLGLNAVQKLISYQCVFFSISST